MWQFAPCPLADFPHVLVLLHGPVHVTTICLYIATPETHHGEAADYERTSTEDNQEDDEGWGNLEAHVVSFVDIHGCGGVTVVNVVKSDG